VRFYDWGSFGVFDRKLPSIFNHTLVCTSFLNPGWLETTYVDEGGWRVGRGDKGVSASQHITAMPNCTNYSSFELVAPFATKNCFKISHTL
jgi:hypothetical protein